MGRQGGQDVKITRELLKKAVEAVDENDALEDIDPVELPDMLWMALKSILSHEQEPRDHKVTLRVEALLSGLITDPEEIDVTDYGVRIVSNVDEAFDMISPRITRMEIR
jgi:hypothetical protein